jgi:hypothetical protein
MLEKDMGSERLGVFVDAATGFGGEGATRSGLPNDGRPELPFVVALMVAAVACRVDGDAICDCRAGGLMEPAGWGWECDNGLRARL